MEVKKCFTIYPSRSAEEIKSYELLLKKDYFQGVEIFFPNFLDEKGFNVYTESIKKLQKYHSEFVMHLPYGPTNDLCNLKIFSKVLEMIKAAIDYGRVLSVEKFTLHLGYRTERREEDLNHIIKVLQDLCDYAKSSFIMVENMPSEKEIGYSPQELKYILDMVKRQNLKITFDTGHANITPYSFDEYLDVIGKDIKHIHISDNDGKSDQHQKIGSGNIDFKAFLNRLTTYQGLYCLEILYKDVNDLIANSIDFDNVFK